MSTHRFQLVMNDHAYDTVKTLAESNDVSMTNIILRCIKLGEFIDKAQKDPTSSLIFRENGMETHILFI